MAGISNIIPPEYRLYAGTMLPGNKTGTIDESYFNQDFKDQVKDQVLNKMDWGMEGESLNIPKHFLVELLGKVKFFHKIIKQKKILLDTFLHNMEKEELIPLVILLFLIH